MKEKNPKKKVSRVRVRNPGVIAAFAARLRQMIASTGIAQGDLAAKLGGIPPETLSRLQNGVAMTIAVDMLVGLAEWLEAGGYSVRWLILGAGDMRSQPSDPGGLTGAYRGALMDAMLVALAGRMGVDVSQVMDTWTSELNLPGKGIVVAHIRGLVEKFEAAAESLVLPVESPSAPPRPPYLTVGPEDVPTDPDWWKSFVPVIGRVAAGVGIDTDEAGAYPPAWAGEFLAYEGAPKTAVAVRVVGTSMEPMYTAGDMVVVDPARRADNGQVCCVLLASDGNREVRLKRLRIRGDQAVLESLNPSHPAIRLPVSQVVGAYRIIDQLRGHRPAE
jgi:SOS-response transcriptional repressor LexA/DNA-binding Xre family transcriptional regulator